MEADKASAIEAMEILETMMDSEVAIVVPHLKEMINFSLQVIDESFVLIVYIIYLFLIYNLMSIAKKLKDIFIHQSILM